MLLSDRVGPRSTADDYGHWSVLMVNGLVAVDRDSPGANWGFSLSGLPEKFIRYAVLFSIEFTDAFSGYRHEKQPFLKLVQTLSHFRRFD
ncbi:hypothetical protein GJS26_02455 [Pectobacterium carotovorum subsp. carotovorum]|nr:hypothetical protein [Pectobacterium carotovorum subsp. carotovorum]